jgi:hypothetical protein
MRNKWMLPSIIIVIICGVILQGLLCLADGKDSPEKAAVEFAKAYYGLDGAMSDMLCDELKTADDVNIVDEYLDSMADKAKSRGFGVDCFRYGLVKTRTQTISKNEAEAAVRITGKKKVKINPIYMFVAKIFDLGATTQFDKTINLVKEDGAWKVCGDLFALPEEG